MGQGECPFYESIRTVLSLPVSDKERKARLKKLGVQNTLLNAIHLEISEKAATGDVQAAKYLRDTAMSTPCDAEGGEGMDLSALTDAQLKAIASNGTEET